MIFKTIKGSFLLFLITLTVSCEIRETIAINQDGSGTIEVVKHREEHSYMQLVGENYSKETIFRDTTYVFEDYIKKYNENFVRYTEPEQKFLSEYSKVKVHSKQSAFEKEFRTVISQSFANVEEVPDLYKTDNYASDIKFNYALTAEEHDYRVSYTFDGNTFKRTVKIIDAVLLKKNFDEIESLKKRFSKFQLVQTYTLDYRFPRKIKSVSNAGAKISEDRKSVKLYFLLSDCLQNPESTNLEVVLEEDI
ncbi:hypothetical protein [Flavobacterium acetivorans]|uniref:hypothetical protein n=1 Tax=Flavobacterium acetivorans TaxID=2893883 RepID=UPI001E464B9B|nr:hypothetical protein [Flavobacterium sp. F-29]UFH36844.1 hypothetical protein LNP19_07325 [Flavobacterium sp. F-29]